MNITRKINLYGLLALALVFPMVAGAQSVTEAIATIRGVIESLIPILIGLAVLVFIWGLIKYVVAKDDAAQKEARGVMLWGVIALFVMVAVWGLVNLLVSTFGLEDTSDAPTVIPTVPNAGVTTGS